MGEPTVYAPPARALRLLRRGVTAALFPAGFLGGALLAFSAAAAAVYGIVTSGIYLFLMISYLPDALRYRRVIVCPKALILCYGVYFRSRVLASPRMVISTERLQNLWERRYQLCTLRLRAAGHTFSVGPLDSGDADEILAWLESEHDDT